jgi:hypothetical protein
VDSGPPKITQVDSFNPSFDPVDDYDRKLEPNRPMSQPKDDIWSDINELRNELISKSGPSGPSGSSPGTNSYISSEQKNAVTRMGTNEMVDIQRKPKSKPTSLEGPPPITQMETMNVNFSPNDDYNGQLAGKTPDTQIRKTQFFEQSEAMQENLYEQIVERRHRESFKAEVNPYYMMSYHQSLEPAVEPPSIIHIDTLRPMFKLDDEPEGGLASLCAQISDENKISDENIMQSSSYGGSKGDLGVPGKKYGEKMGKGSPLEFGAHYDNQLGPNDEPHGKIFLEAFMKI